MNRNTIRVRVNHVDSDTAYADVAAIVGIRLATGREIADATAVTIASWWQSPGAIGRDLAALASGAECDREAVLADIDATFPEATEQRDIDALVCLRAYVIRLPYPEIDDTDADDVEIPDAAYVARLSDDRREFLTGQLQESVHFARYWADVENAPGDVAGEAFTLTTENGWTYTATLRTMARGYRLLSSPDANYFNHGYRTEHHGATHTRIAKFNRTNGAEADADAIDSDAALQMGLFDEVIYG